jgi:hypothetical protein
LANPAVSTIFAADPAAHVFNDRLYAYVSYDEPYTNTHDSMVTYHCLSTDNMVDWVDHGRILHLDDVSWATSHMWAIDCNFWAGKYYLVFCAFDAETATFRTGLAVSDLPQGPFKDLGPIEGVDWGQDPSLFIDDDQKPYLVWGGRGSILIGELNQDLRSIKPETIRNLSEDLEGYEGPFLHKYQGKYYLTYPALDHEVWPQRMSYAIAKKPTGPYEPKGVFIGNYEGNSGTIHGSVLEFKGQWYAFYHSAWVSNMPTSRSMMVDKLFYNQQGEILEINPSKAGAVEGPTSTVVVLDCATAPLGQAKLYGAKIATDNSDYTGHGFVTGLTKQEFGVSVVADFGTKSRYQVIVRYRNYEADFHGRITFGNHLFYNGVQNQSYEEYINRGTLFTNTQGKWQEIVIGEIDVEPRDYRIRFNASHILDSSLKGIDLDYIKLVPVS